MATKHIITTIICYTTRIRSRRRAVKCRCQIIAARTNQNKWRDDVADEYKCGAWHSTISTVNIERAHASIHTKHMCCFGSNRHMRMFWCEKHVLIICLPLINKTRSMNSCAHIFYTFYAHKRNVYLKRQLILFLLFII